MKMVCRFFWLFLLGFECSVMAVDGVLKTEAYYFKTLVNELLLMDTLIVGEILAQEKMVEATTRAYFETDEIELLKPLVEALVLKNSELATKIIFTIDRVITPKPWSPFFIQWLNACRNVLVRHSMRNVFFEYVMI